MALTSRDVHAAMTAQGYHDPARYDLSFPAVKTWMLIAHLLDEYAEWGLAAAQDTSAGELIEAADVCLICLDLLALWGVEMSYAQIAPAAPPQMLFPNDTWVLAMLARTFRREGRVAVGYLLEIVGQFKFLYGDEPLEQAILNKLELLQHRREHGGDRREGWKMPGDQLGSADSTPTPVSD